MESMENAQVIQNEKLRYFIQIVAAVLGVIGVIIAILSFVA